MFNEERYDQKYPVTSFESMIASIDADGDLWIATENDLDLSKDLLTFSGYPATTHGQVFLSDSADVTAAAKFADFILAWIERQVVKKLKDDFNTGVEFTFEPEPIAIDENEDEDKDEDEDEEDTTNLFKLNSTSGKWLE